MTADSIVSLLFLVFGIAILVAAFSAAFDDADAQYRRERIALQGVEIEAEILGRFEAGAPQGSKLSMARVPYMASWDPRELELRYVFEGREIVSRGRVSLETFFRTRGMKTLKIKVSPSHPEQWAALV